MPDLTPERLSRAARRIIGLAAQLVALALLIALLSCRVPQVDGRSMEPRLFDGEHVVITTLAYDVRLGGSPPLLNVHVHDVARGDVIAFSRGDGDDARIYIKRVVGLPGDKVATDRGTLTVPRDTLFVVGDNRQQSDDSRSFGPIPLQRVIGRALLVVWPLPRVALIR